MQGNYLPSQPDQSNLQVAAPVPHPAETASTTTIGDVNVCPCPHLTQQLPHLDQAVNLVSANSLTASSAKLGDLAACFSPQPPQRLTRPGQQTPLQLQDITASPLQDTVSSATNPVSGSTSSAPPWPPDGKHNSSTSLPELVYACRFIL